MQYPRPHVMVTREGWYYLFVVLFIIGGSVLREVNLLVVLSGMLLGPLLFNWRLVVRSMKWLEIRRQLPARCEVGQPIRVRIIIENHSAATSWMVTALDGVRKAKQPRRQQVEVWFARLAGHTTQHAGYRIVFSQRGKYRLGPLRVVSRFPFGLLRCTVTHTKRNQVIVWPRIGQLTARWRKLLQGDRIGAQHSQGRRGNDGEFYALRPFANGDSLRMIHWRSTAKVGEPMVRQTERLELPEVSLVIDPYLPREGLDRGELRRAHARLEQLLRMAATIILDVCNEAGGSVTVTISQTEPRTFSSPPNRRFAEQLLDELATLKGHTEAPEQAILAARAATPSARPIVLSSRPAPDSLDLNQQYADYRWLDIEQAIGEYFLDAPAQTPRKTLLRAVNAAAEATLDALGVDESPVLQVEPTEGATESAAEAPGDKEGAHASI